MIAKCRRCKNRTMVRSVNFDIEEKKDDKRVTVCLCAVCLWTINTFPKRMEEFVLELADESLTKI